jgi:hypothetical protein
VTVLRTIGLVAALAIGGCNPASDTSADEKITLEGEWMVTAIDDEAPAPDIKLNLDFGPELMRLVPGCAEAKFIYSLEGQAFRADRVQYRYEEDMDPSYVRPPPCLILLPGQQEAAERISYAERARSLSDQSVRLAGRRGSVTLSRTTP